MRKYSIGLFLELTDVCIARRRFAEPNLNTIAATWYIRYASKIPSCDAGWKKFLVTLGKIQYRRISGAIGVCSLMLSDEYNFKSWRFFAGEASVAYACSTQDNFANILFDIEARKYRATVGKDDKASNTISILITS